ncbi:unnamed protein product [Euphydryas editha]|uniref:CRAL-TRIO domain-containing protein n=1 Tax=Euphydryas editha TaxID=104508 RepID=A0AAU9U849_EUPED|nr:unnamed protein product [Euphydryas editha]
MDFITKDPILEFKPDTLEYIRKQYNLDKPGQMKKSIDILRDWVQKQNHLRKRDFSDDYYERAIISCKGSIERAKGQLDRICTMRTLLPHFFTNCNVKTDLGNVIDAVYTIFLPKLTDDHYRVEIVKLNDISIQASQNMDYFRSTIVLAEYARAHDYMNGVIAIIDITEANLVDYLSKINPTYLRQALSIYIEGYGIRIKSIHLVTTSKVLDVLLAMVKQVMSPKIAGRVHIHKTIEEIHEFVPKHILPKDYGGEERSIKELNAEWLDVLASDSHVQYMREMNGASTDENCRQSDKFNEQCAGMPGTFRLLSID